MAYDTGHLAKLGDIKKLIDKFAASYIKGLSASGTAITYTKGDGTTGTINTQDTKVTNTLAKTTKAYVTGTTSATTNTGTQVFDTGVYLDTVAGQLTATTFKGALSGNASSATKLATARTLKIGDAAKTFDGTANVTWTLDEMGIASDADLTALKLKVLTDVTENEFTVTFDTLDEVTATGVWNETGAKIEF